MGDLNKKEIFNFQYSIFNVQDKQLAEGNGLLKLEYCLLNIAY